MKIFSQNPISNRKQVDSIHHLMFCGLFLLLVGCSDPGSPEDGIERYIRALITKDRNRAIGASCKDWEDQAIIEVDSFELVKTQLESLACQMSASAGDVQLVTCQGKIITTYDGETLELDLSANTYLAVAEEGEWKMCGYKQ